MKSLRPPSMLAISLVVVSAVLLAVPVASASAVVPTAVSGALTSTAQRLSGGDRYATSVAISGSFAAGVRVVYVATGVNYPDALSAAPAAAALGGPLLLTEPGSLPGVVSQEIKRLAPAEIVVVGGVAAVSSAVYGQLTKLAPSIRRDSGVDRYETSRTINSRAFPMGSATAFIATGANFPDALSASAAAGSIGAPVVLVDGSAAAVAPPTIQLITSLHVSKVSVAGGPAVISEGLINALGTVPGIQGVTRLSGQDRYTTSIAINRGSFQTASTVFFAVGTGFADALAGAALAGRDHAPLFVTPGNCVYADALTEMARLGSTTHVLLGGSAALGSGVENLVTCESLVPPGPSAPARPTGSVNCSDFSTWQQAQAYYERYYPYYGDFAGLDRNKDGIACETLRG